MVNTVSLGWVETLGLLGILIYTYSPYRLPLSIQGGLNYSYAG